VEIWALSKFKRTARTLGSFTYVLFRPPQLSWLPNPNTVLRYCPQGVAVLSARRRCWCVASSCVVVRRASNFALLRTVGKEERLFICADLGAFEKLSHSSTSVIRGMVIERDVLVMTHNFTKPTITSQIMRLCTPVLSSSYDVSGGTRVTNPLKTNTNYITFTTYLAEMHETCNAQRIKRHSSLPTVRKKSRHLYVVREYKVEDPRKWFQNNLLEQRNWSQKSNSDTMRKKATQHRNWIR
jgi:hypothetical protein